MDSPPEDRPPLVLAMGWSSRVMAIALEMALPSAAGYWLDQQLGTKRLLLILGAIFGLCVGMWHLISLTKSPPGSGELSDRSTGDSRGRGK